MGKRTLPKIFICLWAAVLIVLGMYYLFLAPRDSEYSQEENRTLAGFPDITAQSILDGSFGQDMETYLLDRFPFRNTVISLVNRLHNMLSFASHEEYLQIADGPTDPLDSGDYAGNIDDLLNDFDTQPPVSTVPPTTQPQQTETAPDPTQTEPAQTQPTQPAEFPPIEEKPAASLEDFPYSLCLFMDQGNGPVAVKGYERTNVAAVTAVLNKYARLLPRNGKLMFTVVPQSSVANRFAGSSNKVSFYATWDSVVNGLGDDNVYAFDAAEILAEPLRQGEYVYFRTDMHWTPYGSYLVYSEMAQRAGKTPCSYTGDFALTVEEPFRGTYYRDNPTAYMDVKADTLDLLMPNFPLEWRRVTEGEAYEVQDFLDLDAPGNDRYTVYLGGPDSWAYAACDNGQPENCLLICDSFGLGYLPFLTANYGQVHYYDPRYFDHDATQANIAQMIERYNIQDIYVVVGDLHSFESSFLLTDANNQLTKD